MYKGVVSWQRNHFRFTKCVFIRTLSNTRTFGQIVLFNTITLNAIRIQDSLISYIDRDIQSSLKRQFAKNEMPFYTFVSAATTATPLTRRRLFENERHQQSRKRRRWQRHQ